MNRLSNRQTALSPLDLFVLLYLASDKRGRMTYAQLGNALGIAPSQTHASVRRAKSVRLLTPDSEGPVVHRAALQEFVVHGAKYAFPAVLGPPSRGVPTSYAAPPLCDTIVQGGEAPPVWPYSKGEVRGVAVYPLHPTAPEVAVHDRPFYEMLALFDALRMGAAREREMATDLLVKRI